MTKFITDTFPPTILDKDSSVRISIYMPTHRTAPDNRQDVILFKNLVSKLEDKGGYDVQVEKLRALEHNQDFWLHNLDSLGILMDNEDLVIYRLPIKVSEYMQVGERFYLKPLIKNFQFKQEYHVLGLARDHFRLYKGSNNDFKEVPIDDEDRLLTEVLGDVFDGNRLNVVSQGGGSGIFHGHGAKSEEVKKDTQKFFFHVDKFIRSNYSLKDKLPLILITPTENQSLFREQTNNEYLMKKEIARSYDDIKLENLHKVLSPVLDEIYNNKVSALLAEYNTKINKGLAINKVEDAVKVINENRVKTLVLKAEKQVFGKIDVDNNTIEFLDQGEDVLNHLAQLALATGSDVVILPADQMPDDTDLFAILRF